MNENVISELLTTGEGREQIAAALASISGEWTSHGNRPASIPLRRVLSSAWAPYRLERLRAVRKPDPIKVVIYRIGSERFYVPSDGNHRAELARERNQRTIRAMVSGEYACDPARFAVVRTDYAEGVLRDFTDGRLSILDLAEVSDELRKTLVALGVRECGERGTATWLRLRPIMEA